MAGPWLERRAKAAARRAGFTVLAALLALGAFGAAVIGGSILLSARIGAANASFVVAGALLVLGVIALLLARSHRPPPVIEAAEPLLRDIARGAALNGISRLSGRQMLFVSAVAMLGLSAFLLGADEDQKDRDG